MRYHGHIRPSVHRAKIGDVVKFQCLSDVDVSWKFNNGRLPADVLSYNEETSDVYILTVFTDKSNYGFYSCEGELYDGDMAFYDVAALVVKEGKDSIEMLLWYWTDMAVLIEGHKRLIAKINN